MHVRPVLPALVLALAPLTAVSAEPQTVVEAFVHVEGSGIAYCDLPTHSICDGTGTAQMLFVSVAHGVYNGPVPTDFTIFKSGAFGGVIRMTVNGVAADIGLRAPICIAHGPDFSTGNGYGAMDRQVAADGLSVSFTFECTAPLLEAV